MENQGTELEEQWECRESGWEWCECGESGWEWYECRESG